MTNGSDPATKHFSYDELGVREMYITFFVLQTLLAAWARLGVRRGTLAVNKYHRTVSLLVNSVGVTWVSHLFSMIYYIR